MIPFNHDSYSKKFLLFLLYLAPFQAGYINVGAFHIADGFFVSHVTGTSSMIGMGIGKLDLTIFVTFLTVLLSFILGASFAGYYLKYYKEVGREPRYSFVMFVKFLFFGIILLLSESDLFLTSKEVLYASHLLMLFLLSFCCGVQNSSSSISTGGFLKPTHMTGLSTDVGANLYMFFIKSDREEYEKLKTRIVILFSFILGGTLAELIFSIQGHYGFLFPFLTSFIFWFYSNQAVKKLRLKFGFIQVTLSLVLISTFALGVVNFTANYIN